MKQSEMNEQQREAKRKYDREAKQRSRAKEKADRAASQIPDAWDYEVTPPQQEQLTGYLKDTLTAIQKGGVKLTELDEEVIDGVASCVFGFEHGIQKIVTNPNGMFVCGRFPDAIASLAIQHVHQHPAILQSAAFAELYHVFIGQVLDWAKKNEVYADRSFLTDVRLELAGDYIIKVKPCRPEPPKRESEQNIPSAAELLEHGRIKMLNQIEPSRTAPRRVLMTKTYR